MFPVLLLGTEEPDGHSCADRVLSLMAKKKNKTLFFYLKCIKSESKRKTLCDKCFFLPTIMNIEINSIIHDT